MIQNFKIFYTYAFKISKKIQYFKIFYTYAFKISKMIQNFKIFYTSAFKISKMIKNFKIFYATMLSKFQTMVGKNKSILEEASCLQVNLCCKGH